MTKLILLVSYFLKDCQARFEDLFAPVYQSVTREMELEHVSKSMYLQV
jgi:hypothetical protein